MTFTVIISIKIRCAIKHRAYEFKEMLLNEIGLIKKQEQIGYASISELSL